MDATGPHELWTWKQKLEVTRVGRAGCAQGIAHCPVTFVDHGPYHVRHCSTYCQPLSTINEISYQDYYAGCPTNPIWSRPTDPSIWAWDMPWQGAVGASRVLSATPKKQAFCLGLAAWGTSGWLPGPKNSIFGSKRAILGNQCQKTARQAAENLLEN